MSDVRVQRFLKRPLVSTDVPDERVPILTTQGAMSVLELSIRPLEEYSPEELRQAAERIPAHQLAAFRGERYDGPNRDGYLRGRAMGLSRESAAVFAERGVLPANAAFEEVPPMEVAQASVDDTEGTPEQAFVTNSRNEKVRQAYARLNQLLDEFYDSDRWKDYLSFAARFHRYSPYNQWLIYAQRPNATFVAGYKKWLEMGRHVMRGERGIAIWAPYTVTVEREVEETDEDGNTVRVTRQVPETRFKVVTVFDVSQTEGDPLPTLGPEHQIEGDRHQALFERLRRVVERNHRIQILPEEEMRGARGFFRPSTGEIALSASNSVNQNAKTLVHEYAHALLHSNPVGRSLPAEQKEVEAEAVAFIVCEAFGFDTSEYSVGYVGAYNHDDKRRIRQSVERITRTAGKIIEEIERESLAEAERNARQAASVRLQGRAMEAGRPVYRDFSLDEIAAKAATSELSIEAKRFKLNGRDVEAGTGVSSFSVGGDYGTLELRGGKLVLHTEVRGEIAEVEIEPGDVEMVSILS